jgi:hypothetical protein
MNSWSGSDASAFFAASALAAESSMKPRVLSAAIQRFKMVPSFFSSAMRARSAGRRSMIAAGFEPSNCNAAMNVVRAGVAAATPGLTTVRPNSAYVDLVDV